MEALYFDHAATTPLHPDVASTMSNALTEAFGNPSSIHQLGRLSRKIVDEARTVIAKSLGANDKDIIFTSGGTEADNLAIIGTALKHQDKGKHIITSAIEHHAVLDSCHYLETLGFTVTYLPVDETGVVGVEAVKEALTDETILVSVMMVNNEVGTIQPIKAMGELLEDHQALFHTDAVQAYGIMPLDVEALHVDLLTVTAHKINGPKGIGALYKRREVKLQPLFFGGDQERKRRPGTENLPGIAGFKQAVELFLGEELNRQARFKQLKALFEQELTTIDNIVINGDEKKVSPLICNVSFLGTRIEQVLMNLDLDGVFVSSGSACTAGAMTSSHVLKAMYGEQDERTLSAIRFSFGLHHTEQAMIEVTKRVKQTIERLRKLSE
ncbi:putative cysteine desulfurase IscS 1 [Halolactibacillus miurensis]|uniref:cysteine desulfurase n=1 Tax=Halolactibacillus miurensis TaxID=306541 RepID=A0A1I6PLU3_9BACI|nr:cysteine desulfurase family protein [Halolactibacillus miurensis]GEM03757.1 putative cysteine desulfurase IscS 1 [Halolactibacillus miurensis]SFS41183.1 cysteine desulfurase [Halolactibacillus miurensis]